MSLGTEAVPFTMPVEPAGTSNNNGNCGGWGGDWSAWIVIFLIFAMFGGWGGMGGFGGGWGGNNAGMQGALTRADLCSEFNFNGLENGVRNINDAVNLGFSNLNSTICHQQYDTAMLVNGVNANLSNGFAGLNNAVCTLGYQNAQLINGVDNTVQQGFNAANVVALQNQNALQTQLAQCCCENRQGQADIKYQIAADTCAVQNTLQNNTRDIIDSQNSGFRAILDKMCQQELAAKDAQIAAQNQKIFGLELSASQQAQNNYLVNQLRPCPVPSYITCNPWASQAPYGSCGTYNSGCNGCGC